MALREIDAGQSCIATAKRYAVAKSTVSHCLEKQAEKVELVQAVEGKHAFLKEKKNVKREKE